jgi:hypothetical protein
MLQRRKMMNQPVIPTQADHSMPYRTKAIEALAEFRQEWERVTEGESLLDVTAPIGLLLVDVAVWLEFTQQERNILLGKKLTKDIEAFETQSVEFETKR